MPIFFESYVMIQTPKSMESNETKFEAPFRTHKASVSHYQRMTQVLELHSDFQSCTSRITKIKLATKTYSFHFASFFPPLSQPEIKCTVETIFTKISRHVQQQTYNWLQSTNLKSQIYSLVARFWDILKASSIYKAQQLKPPHKMPLFYKSIQTICI